MSWLRSSPNVGDDVYSSYLWKSKGCDARARWLQAANKRLFTIDFNHQLVTYSSGPADKSLYRPIPFRDIVRANFDEPPQDEQASQASRGRTSSRSFGRALSRSLSAVRGRKQEDERWPFVLETTKRRFELAACSHAEAMKWVHLFEMARKTSRSDASWQDVDMLREALIANAAKKTPESAPSCSTADNYSLDGALSSHERDTGGCPSEFSEASLQPAGAQDVQDSRINPDVPSDVSGQANLDPMVLREAPDTPIDQTGVDCQAWELAEDLSAQQNEEHLASCDEPDVSAHEQQSAGLEPGPQPCASEDCADNFSSGTACASAVVLQTQCEQVVDAPLLQLSAETQQHEEPHHILDQLGAGREYGEDELSDLPAAEAAQPGPIEPVRRNEQPSFSDDEDEDSCDEGAGFQSYGYVPQTGVARASADLALARPESMAAAGYQPKMAGIAAGAA